MSRKTTKPTTLSALDEIASKSRNKADSLTNMRYALMRQYIAADSWESFWKSIPDAVKTGKILSAKSPSNQVKKLKRLFADVSGENFEPDGLDADYDKAVTSLRKERQTKARAVK